jgi:hypothetical protein
MLHPNDEESEPTTDSIARLHRSIVDPTLLAAEEPTGIDETLHIDEFAQPRAELLYAYHQSAAYRQQAATPYRRPGPGTLPPGIAPEENPVESQDEIIATMGPSQAFAEAEGQEKIANRFEPELNTDNIAENYIGDSNRPRPMDRNGEPFHAELTMQDEPDDFLSVELNRIQPEKIATLSTTKLMRLLQHGDEQIVTAARKTLAGRDGFRDRHLKLAFQLYHPLPSVRAELVGLLPNIGGIQQSVWLTELLNDPNSEVRFLAASAIATSSDPSMQRLLADKGKRDADPRIIELAERALEQQRKVRR